MTQESPKKDDTTIADVLESTETSETYDKNQISLDMEKRERDLQRGRYTTQ